MFTAALALVLSANPAAADIDIVDGPECLIVAIAHDQAIERFEHAEAMLGLAQELASQRGSLRGAAAHHTRAAEAMERRAAELSESMREGPIDDPEMDKRITELHQEIEAERRLAEEASSIVEASGAELRAAQAELEQAGVAMEKAEQDVIDCGG